MKVYGYKQSLQGKARAFLAQLMQVKSKQQRQTRLACRHSSLSLAPQNDLSTSGAYPPSSVCYACWIPELYSDAASLPYHTCCICSSSIYVCFQGGNSFSRVHPLDPCAALSREHTSTASAALLVCFLLQPRGFDQPSVLVTA